MTEFYCGGVIVVVVLVLYPWKPRKILELLRVEPMTLVSCSWDVLPQTHGCYILTDLLSKVVPSKTNWEELVF